MKKTLEPKHTLSLLFQFLAVVSLGFGVFGLLTITLLNKRTGLTYLESISVLSQVKLKLPFIIFTTTLIQALALGAAVLLLTLLWSHAISGPLVRLRRYLKEISACQRLPTQAPSFRNTDQLHGIAEAFFELVIKQEACAAQASGLLVQAQKILDDCLVLDGQGKTGTDEFDLRLKDLKKIYSQIKNIIEPEE